MSKYRNIDGIAADQLIGGHKTKPAFHGKTLPAALRKHAPRHNRVPDACGLYNPSNEHDACGVGFIANLKNNPTHQIIKDGLYMLENLTHRGAVGADPLMGDGAGILIQIPHKFFRKELAKQNITLPEPGQYAVGHFFMPQDEEIRTRLITIIRESIEAEGLGLIGMRDVPVDNSSLSKAPAIMASEPVHVQVFISRPDTIEDQDVFERRVFLVRKVISNRVHGETAGRDNGFYPVSLSSRTIVYKGMFLAYQVGKYYLDLADEDFESALGTWSISAFRPTHSLPGNWPTPIAWSPIMAKSTPCAATTTGWLPARHRWTVELFGNDIEKLWPISYEGQSDTACFDNALEFLFQGGYSLPHAMMMLIPEAWAGNNLMSADRKAFYEYHAALMEPWDGPAAVAFTDGRHIGATLDRNGLRPARYIVTNDDQVIMASEAGVLPVAEEKIIRKWRLQPGKMLLIDLEKGDHRFR